MFGLISTVKSYLSLILIIVTILSMLSGIGLAWYANYQSNEADRYEANARALLIKVKTYKDKNGLLVTESYELRFTVAELKNSNDSTLRDMANQVEAMKIKLKNTQNISMLTTKSVGHGKVIINKSEKSDKYFDYYDSLTINDDSYPYDTTNISKLPTVTIDDGFLKMDITLGEDSLVYEYTNKDSLIIVGHRHRRMCTKNGKNRFFIARWISPDWQYKVSAKSYNPNTVIEDIKNIHIETRKGKERKI